MPTQRGAPRNGANRLFTIAFIISGMDTVRANAALISLETAAASARSGFVCMFSTSDEYETALITERRAQGRYDRPRINWPMYLFFACCLMVVGIVVLFS